MCIKRDSMSYMTMGTGMIWLTNENEEIIRKYNLIRVEEGACKSPNQNPLHVQRI